MNLSISFLACLSQRLEEIVPVHIVQENILPSVGSVHDAVHRDGIFDSQLPWHSGDLLAMNQSLSTGTVKDRGLTRFPGTTNRGTWPDYGQSIVPVGLNDAVGVAAGFLHSVALKRDGRVVVWGDGSAGQKNVPFGLSGVTAIDAGGFCTVALLTNGTVVAWGNIAGPTNVPSGLTDVIAVSTDGSHCLALTRDGTVVGWGLGTTNTGQYPNYGQAITAGLTNVIVVAAGNTYSAIIQADLQINSLELVGQNAKLVFHAFAGRQYSLDFSTNLNSPTWVPVPGANVNGNGAEVVVVHTNAISAGPRSFYRAIQQ